MNTKTITAFLLASCSALVARPGDLDRSFDPELRAWVAPDHVSLAADGRAWIGGGFDRGDGYSTGDLVKLGENGGVESEPALGYLERDPNFTYREVFYPSSTPGVAGNVGYQLVKSPATPFLLANGDFLLPTASSSWLRMSAASEVIGKAFPDRVFGETITPQFERDGKLWVIREGILGTRVLQRRNSSDGSLDSTFSQAASLPTNVNEAVPGVNDSVWAAAGNGFSKLEAFPYPLILADQHQLFQMDASGRQIGVKKTLRTYREPHLIAGPAGSFRIAYGIARSRDGFYWQGEFGSIYNVIDWFSAAGNLQKSRNFYLPYPTPFLWTEAEDGSYLATHYLGVVQKFTASGVIDRTFPSPGRARSVKALPGGKWLIDGLRRLNADGSEDPTWTVPQLTKSAEVTALLPLSNGRVLAGGNFATADGLVRNRLAIFFADGTVDPSFVPDDRIGEWRSVAVSGQAIYVVTADLLNFGNRQRSNLAKLRMDGSLNENYDPTLPTSTWVGNLQFGSSWNIDAGGHITEISQSAPSKLPDKVAKVHALPDGEILVESISPLDDTTFYRSLARLRPDGMYDLNFQDLQSEKSVTPLLVRANGGFVIAGAIYRPSGEVERDLTRPDCGLTPLCEWSGGILFQESKSEVQGVRLRLWTKRGWANGFNPPLLNRVISATPGEFGMLYLNAVQSNDVQALLRLLLTGRIDSSFRPPVFGHRERQYAGDWWKAEESGKASIDLVIGQTPMFPQVILWQPSSRRLWTGGNFNMVDGQPRDGLARIQGGLFWNR